MHWLPPLVGILADPHTAAPVKVVNGQSAMLVEPGLAHHAPAPPVPGYDPLCEGGDRGSVFATIAELPETEPKVLGSFLAQRLETLHLLPRHTRLYDVQVQYSALTAAYYTGCGETMFKLLRAGRSMVGDEATKFWAAHKRDMKVMEAAAVAVGAPPAGTSFTSGSGGKRNKTGDGAKKVRDDFMAAWFSEQREQLHMD
jgi:hypothetical protein